MPERQESGKTEKTEREEGLELALQLMGASAEGLANTTNSLIDNLTAERDELRATLAAIRDQIDGLFGLAWTPSQTAILRAIWPSKDVINRYQQGETRS
jgi:hypothetical protein